MINYLYTLKYNEYLDKRNQVSNNWSLYVKVLEDNKVKYDGILLYQSFSENWIKIALEKYKNYLSNYLYSFITENNLPTMFEVNDQVFKLEYVFPEQSCVVGLPIIGNSQYLQVNPDREKYDYGQSFITFYDRGICLVKGNQLFLDGELLYNSIQLKTLCNNIEQDFNKLDYQADKLITFLKTNYPNVKGYVCNGFSSWFNKKEV